MGVFKILKRDMIDPKYPSILYTYEQDKIKAVPVIAVVSKFLVIERIDSYDKIETVSLDSINKREWGYWDSRDHLVRFLISGLEQKISNSTEKIEKLQKFIYPEEIE